MLSTLTFWIVLCLAPEAIILALIIAFLLIELMVIVAGYSAIFVAELLASALGSARKLWKGKINR